MSDTNVVIIGTIPTYQGGYQVSLAAYPVGLTQQPVPSPLYHGNPTYNNNTHGYYHHPKAPEVVPPMTGDYPLSDPHQVAYANFFKVVHIPILSYMHTLSLSFST